MTTSEKGRKFIKEFEVLELTSYQDQGGVWTIGYGTIRYPNVRQVKQGETITEKEAEFYFVADLRNFERVINEKGLNLSQNQFDAVAAFVYNVGANAFSKSTLLKVLRADPDNNQAVEAQFKRWIFVRKNGKATVSKGLKNRRHHEIKIYKYSDYESK